MSSPSDLTVNATDTSAFETNGAHATSVSDALAGGSVKIVFAGDVTSIPENFLKNQTNVVAVEFPNSLQSIGSSAFEGCTGLTSVTLPSGVISVETDAFKGCSALKSLDARALETKAGEPLHITTDKFAIVNNTINDLWIQDGYRLITDKYVGVGTTNPARPLEVQTLSDEIGLRTRFTPTLFTDYKTNGVDVNPSSQHFAISHAGTERFRVHSNGNVGIGTTTPNYKLEVSGTPTTLGGSAYYGSYLHYVGNNDSGSFEGTFLDIDKHHAEHSPNVNRDFVARFNGNFFSNGAIVIASDLRIKKDITLVDDDRALNIVNQLESKEYHYIDPERRRPMKTIGLIAQEVKDVVPNAVSLQKDWVPDEMRIIAEPQWDNLVLTIPDLDMTPENLTGKCKFYVSNDPSGNDEVCKEIDCEKDASGNKTNQFKFEEEYVNVFFYGKEVNDFHTLDKNQIFALHHSAIQELSRKNAALEAKHAALEATNASKDAEIAQLKADIALIKKNLGL